MAELRVDVETALPESLPAGRGDALFIFGTCFHPTAAVRGLELLANGIAHPVSAERMPRFDRYASLHPSLGSGEQQLPDVDPDSAEDPEIRSYRSGFWATVPVATGAPGTTLTLTARARLDDGTEVSAPIAEITAAAPPLPPAPDAGPTIAICMSTYDPDIELLRAQIDSIREQTDRDWVCLISDDCSRPERYREIEAVIGGDQRFRLSRSESRNGFYRGFERALGMVPADASLVALCDQDDRWHPDKLATLRAALGDAELVYSDQRLVDPGGELIADSYWGERANNYTSLSSLLIANTITGAAALIRREVVERALPFPDVPGDQYHDHWLGLVALTLGEIAYVDRPLYDYVQHRGAALGHAAANAGLGPATLRERLSPSGLRRWIGDGRGGYFFANQRLATLAEALLARCPQATRPKRRALRRFAAADARPVRSSTWLGARSLRALGSRNETLGGERLLIQGIAWRWALSLRARGVERPAGWIYDASMPPLAARSRAPEHREAETAQIERLVAPLELALSEREPERVNVLIPTIDLKHLFGGYIAKFNLASRLAQSGRRVRIVTVDPTPPLPSDWRERVQSYSGLTGALERVEVEFAREGRGGLAINPRDTFVATTWWTAHIAAAAVEQTSRQRFLYLIQEYEPYTFEMGSLAALAMQSYEFPHLALFSTEFLRRFFAAHGHGVFAAGSDAGQRDSLAFENAITAAAPPPPAEISARTTRRLLFYARSEQHARRNMFELGLIALAEAVRRGAFSGAWEFRGVGSVSGRSRIALPGGAELTVLPRTDQASYGRMLADHDVGLALMFTPHPSLVPLEMASAGLLTVTNSFDTKTADRLEALSANLIAAPPTIAGVVAGLERAIAGCGDGAAREAGATVAWPTDWDDSFSAPVIAAITALLDRC